MSSAELDKVTGFSHSSKRMGMEGYQWQLETQHTGAPGTAKPAKKLVEYRQPQRPGADGFKRQQQMQWGR